MLDTLACNGKSHAYTTDDSVDRDQRDDRGNLSWAAEPQHSKVGPGVPSVGARQGLDGAPMVLIPAGPFTMGSDAARWRSPRVSAV